MPLNRTNGSTLALIVTGVLAAGSLVRRGSAAGNRYRSLQDVPRGATEMRRGTMDGVVAETALTRGDFSKGTTEIWYFLPEFGLDAGMGYEWLVERGRLPTKQTLKKTHAHLGSVVESNLETIWKDFQGENWSPRGEARDLIESKGLHHTSMSVGDVVVIDGAAYLVDRWGFRALPASIRDVKGSRSIPPYSPMDLEKFSPKAVDGSREFLLDILAHLRAQRWDFWTTHWQVHGVPFYGDHLLFERLYTGPINDQTDQLGEKMTAFFGADSVDSVMVLDGTRALVAKWSAIKNPYERALASEKSLQDAIMRAVMWMREYKTITLGLDDYLMSLANQHETNAYLLQQRVIQSRGSSDG